MKWVDLTSPEISALPRDVPLVMNISAVEQHGAHLPVGTDAMIGAHVLDRLDAALDKRVLILPGVSVCCSAHHMDFGGTLSVSHATLAAYVSDIIDSVLRQGFRNIVLFNSHGGNQAIGQVIVETLGPRWPEAQIVLATWWTLAHEALMRITQSGAGGVGHACEFETSLIQHMSPEQVRGALIADPELPQTYEWAAADMLNGGRASLYRSMKAQSGGSGVVGRPSFASADKGARISDAVLDALTRLIVSLTEN